MKQNTTSTYAYIPYNANINVYGCLFVCACVILTSIAPRCLRINFGTCSLLEPIVGAILSYECDAHPNEH